MLASSICLVEETADGWAVHIATRKLLGLIPSFGVKTSNGSALQSMLDPLPKGAKVFILPLKAIAREVFLPLELKASAVRSALQIDGSKHTPFRAEELVFAFRAIKKEGAAERQELVVSYLPKSEIRRLQGVAGKQHQPQVLARFPGEKAADILTSLLWTFGSLETRAYELTEQGRAPAIAMGVRVVVLLLVFLGIVLPANWYMQHRIERRLASVQQELQALSVRADRVRTQLDYGKGLKQQLAAYEVTVGERDIPLDLLVQLSKVLEGQSFINQINYRQQEGYLEVSGQSENAALLLKKLQDGQWGSDWRFVRNVHRGGQERLEFFQISGQLPNG